MPGGAAAPSLPAAGRRGLLPASPEPSARPPGLARPPPPPPRAPTCWSPPRAGQRRQGPPRMRRAALPRPRSRAGPHGGPRRFTAFPASPTHSYRPAWGGGWRGPAPRVEDAPRGARDPGRPGRGTRAADGGGGRGGRGRRRAGGGGGAGPTISSSPGAEAEREVPRAPPPSALPPRRLSAAGSRHDAETASKRNRLRRAAPPRSPSPPPPERRHRLGSLPLPGARLRRRRRARPAFPPTRERGAGPGGACPGGKGRGLAAARAPPGKLLRSGRGAADGSGAHAALRGRAGLPKVGAPVTARQRAPCAPGQA